MQGALSLVQKTDHDNISAFNRPYGLPPAQDSGDVENGAVFIKIINNNRDFKRDCQNPTMNTNRKVDQEPYKPRQHAEVQ